MPSRRYVNENMRVALHGRRDRAGALRSLRRVALRQGDEMLAAACVLQRMLLEADAEQRWRLLRLYAKETGSPFAAYLLSERLKVRGLAAAADRVWALVKWKPSDEYLPNEDAILASLFDYALPTTGQVRRHLLRLRD